MKYGKDNPSYLVKGDKIYDVTHMMLGYRNYCVLTKYHSMLNANVFAKKVIDWVSVQEKRINDESEFYNFIIDNIDEHIFLDGFSRTEVQKISQFIIAEKNRLDIIAALDDTKKKKCYRKNSFTRSKTRKK